MGIERARVVEVHSGDAARGRVVSGYQISGALVLTCGGSVDRRGRVGVRPAGTAVWLDGEVVWTAPSGSAAVVVVEDPWSMVLSPGPVRWGRPTGRQPVAVTAVGFAPATGRPAGARDPQQFFGQLQFDATPAADGSLPVQPGGGHRSLDGMAGAALFAGPALVAVVVAGPPSPGTAGFRAVPISDLVDDEAFVGVVGDGRPLALSPIGAAIGFPILQMP